MRAIFQWRMKKHFSASYKLKREHIATHFIEGSQLTLAIYTVYELGDNSSIENYDLSANV